MANGARIDLRASETTYIHKISSTQDTGQTKSRARREEKRREEKRSSSSLGPLAVTLAVMSLSRVGRRQQHAHLRHYDRGTRQTSPEGTPDADI